jgi:hypothetical protein
MDVWDAVDRWVEIMEKGIWRREEFNQKGAVT